MRTWFTTTTAFSREVGRDSGVYIGRAAAEAEADYYRPPMCYFPGLLYYCARHVCVVVWFLISEVGNFSIGL